MYVAPFSFELGTDKAKNVIESLIATVKDKRVVDNDEIEVVLQKNLDKEKMFKWRDIIN